MYHHEPVQQTRYSHDVFLLVHATGGFETLRKLEEPLRVRSRADHRRRGIY